MIFIVIIITIIITITFIFYFILLYHLTDELLFRITSLNNSRIQRLLLLCLALMFPVEKI